MRSIRKWIAAAAVALLVALGAAVRDSRTAVEGLFHEHPVPHPPVVHSPRPVPIDYRPVVQQIFCTQLGNLIHGHGTIDPKDLIDSVANSYFEHYAGVEVFAVKGFAEHLVVAAEINDATNPNAARVYLRACLHP